MNIQPASVVVEGRRVRGVIVTCKCGVATQVAVNTVHNSVPRDQEVFRDAIVARKLEEKGWRLLKPKDGHSCPGCVAARRSRQELAEQKPKLTVVKDFKEMVIKNAHHAGPSAEATLTRENRRIILAKIEEVYIDEKTGYSADWSDAKVATDLGVPRAWVTQLRSENFGPESNEINRQILQEAKAVLAEIRSEQKTNQPFAERMAALDRRAEKIERTIIDVEKRMGA
jgi:hypothetical protein